MVVPLRCATAADLFDQLTRTVRVQSVRGVIHTLHLDRTRAFNLEGKGLHELVVFNQSCRYIRRKVSGRMTSGLFSSLSSLWPCRAERKLCALGMLFAFAAAGPAQALIDYHQHLLMPNEKSPKGFFASDLVTLLDEAHIKRALVLSMAYRYGNPNQPPVADEYAHVKAENDWVSQQVARYADRLRAFCGVDPLKDYALAEIARCARDPNLHYGLKMHFGNSDVDLENPEHVARLHEVFQAASRHHMAIAVHMHSSVTRHRPYGAREAQTFLDRVLPAARGTHVQIAHFSGSGGYDDPGTDEALRVFIRAIQKHDSRMKQVYFDITNVAGLGNWESKRNLIAERTREIGVSRVLFGSDGNFGGGVTPAHAWADFRKLPLTEVEFRAIESNIAPYMR